MVTLPYGHSRLERLVGEGSSGFTIGASPGQGIACPSLRSCRTKACCFSNSDASTASDGHRRSRGKLDCRLAVGGWFDGRQRHSINPSLMALNTAS